MFVSFSVIPPIIPAHGPEDLLIPAIGNHSQFPASIQIIGEADIILPSLVNLSVVNVLTITSGEDDDIILDDVLTNVSTLSVGIEIALAPADAQIYPPTITNTSDLDVVGNIEIALAPADAQIYPPTITNVSGLGAIEVAADTFDELFDEDDIAGAFVAGNDLGYDTPDIRVTSDGDIRVTSDGDTRVTR